MERTVDESGVRGRRLVPNAEEVSANPKSFDPGGSGFVDGLGSLDELKDLRKRRKVVGRAVAEQGIPFDGNRALGDDSHKARASL